MRVILATVCVACALTAGSTAWRADANPRPTPSALTSRESLRQTLVFRPRGVAAGLTVRERRTMRATLSVLLPALDETSVTGNTYVGLRIGTWTFERPVSFDRAWKPGKTRAAFRVDSTDPKRPGFTTVRADWTGGVLDVRVVSTSEAPLAAADVAAAAGPLSTSIDGAARLGDQHVHLGGAATGTMTRTNVPVLDSSTDLARVNLVGHADVVADTTDTTAPSVVVTAPADGSTHAPGTVRIAGTVRDDRTIESVSYVLDFGSEVQEPFALDPSTGFLDDARATFAFDIPATPGLHAVVVFARDVADNFSFARTNFLVPVAGAVSLRAGLYDVVAVDDKSRVQTWGTGPGPVVASPQVVPGFVGVRAAAENLVLFGDGTVSTISGDPAGATSTGTLAPVPVQGLDDIADVAVGAGMFWAGGPWALALRADGSVWTWGAGGAGNLGDGTQTGHYPPAKITSLPPIRAIAAGDSFALAIDDQGEVWTWGYDLISEMTTGNPALDLTPRKVVGPSGITSIAASLSQPVAYAVASDGTAWNWGLWLFGQTANASGTTFGFWKGPGVVTGIGPVKSAVLGANHVLLLMKDGTVLASGGGNGGNNYGQLGDGTTTGRSDLRPVPGLANVVSVAAGFYASYLVLDDGTIRAFGRNQFGQLGDGTRTDQLSPVIVTLSQ